VTVGLSLRLVVGVWWGAGPSLLAVERGVPPLTHSTAREATACH